jgi:hypothetical protein
LLVIRPPEHPPPAPTNSILNTVVVVIYDGVVKDVHSVRAMTDKERVAKTAALEAAAARAAKHVLPNIEEL